MSRKQRDLQFYLRDLFFVTTACALFLCLWRTAPKYVVPAIVITVVVAQRTIRRRVKKAHADRGETEDREPSRRQTIMLAGLTRAVGAVSGCIVGAVLALATALVVFWLTGAHVPLRPVLALGALAGFVLGILFPRLFGMLFGWLPF